MSMRLLDQALRCLEDKSKGECKGTTYGLCRYLRTRYGIDTSIANLEGYNRDKLPERMAVRILVALLDIVGSDAGVKALRADYLE